jgi:hypothetical protein
MHTKGPWDYERLFRDAGNHPGDHHTIDDDFLTIIIVEDDFDPEKHDWAEVYGPNQKANARLIAAAPELRRGCMLLLSALDTQTNDNPKGSEWAIEQAKEAALEALRKAKEG